MRVKGFPALCIPYIWTTGRVTEEKCLYLVRGRAVQASEAVMDKNFYFHHSYSPELAWLQWFHCILMLQLVLNLPENEATQGSRMYRYRGFITVNMSGNWITWRLNRVTKTNKDSYLRGEENLLYIRLLNKDYFTSIKIIGPDVLHVIEIYKM